MHDRVSKAILKEHQMSIEDVDYHSHQANMRITEAVVKLIGMNPIKPITASRNMETAPRRRCRF